MPSLLRSRLIWYLPDGPISNFFLNSSGYLVWILRHKEKPRLQMFNLKHTNYYLVWCSYDAYDSLWLHNFMDCSECFWRSTWIRMRMIMQRAWFHRWILPISNFFENIECVSPAARPVADNSGSPVSRVHYRAHAPPLASPLYAASPPKSAAVTNA